MINSNDNKPKGHAGDSFTKQEVKEHIINCTKDLIRLIGTAPESSDADRAWLFLIATSSLIGASCGAMQKANPNMAGLGLPTLAQSLFDLIIPVLEKQAATDMH